MGLDFEFWFSRLTPSSDVTRRYAMSQKRLPISSRTLIDQRRSLLPPLSPTPVIDLVQLRFSSGIVLSVCWSLVSCLTNTESVNGTDITSFLWNAIFIELPFLFDDHMIYLFELILTTFNLIVNLFYSKTQPRFWSSTWCCTLSWPPSLPPCCSSFSRRWICTSPGGRIPTV